MVVHDPVGRQYSLLSTPVRDLIKWKRDDHICYTQYRPTERLKMRLVVETVSFDFVSEVSYYFIL